MRMGVGGNRIPTCCDGLSPATVARRGADPREWDPRMPMPAGAGIDRRRFLLGAAGGLLSVYGAGRLGLGGQALNEGIAQAAEAHGARGPILVSIFLAGGLDSLSVLAPVSDATYRKLRPSLAIDSATAIPFGEDPRLSWSPEAASFAKLHQAGKVTVMPGIGYSDPDMSHFTSRHYWEVGQTSTTTATGWLGRYLDQVGTGTNPLQGLSLDSQMNPTLATARHPVAAMDRPENFSLWMEGVWGDVFSLALDSTARLGVAQRHARDRAIAQVAEAAAESGIVRRALAPFAGKDGKPAYTSPVAYPTAPQGDFPQRLAGLAAMIAVGLPLRCVALSPEIQFDTHASQTATLHPGVKTVADSIAAFQADLEARGLADRVLIHVWSEFGRRALENGSGGTDHGAAGLSMLVGSRVTGTMIGEQPSLTSLDAYGNPRENIDFRSIYCSILEQWFGHDGAAVIPDAHRFPRHRMLT